jgi:hypothetical protein
VNGWYYPVLAGDFFGDGSDDILWFGDPYFGDRLINVWDHTVSGGVVTRTRSAIPMQDWGLGL